MNAQADETKNNNDIFQKYKDFHVNEPLGPIDSDIPFEIKRTHRDNLPVYSDFRLAGAQKRTIIRNISGDVIKFKEELSKIVSNSEITEKMGRVEVSGVHTAKVKLWLTRLGF